MQVLRLPSQASWQRSLLLLWATLCMLAFPLFHSHLEADHHHGGLHHVHATVHSIFSSDFLSSYSAEAPLKHPILTHHIPSVEDDPEIGFSLTASKDRDTGKPVHHAICSEGLSWNHFGPCPLSLYSVTKPPRAVLASGDSSRAPPFPSI